MRFIRGDNLEAAAKQFHANEAAGPDAGTRTLALQKLLRRFLDVCNAIAYAHSRGVVHRDLKPGNIMLGQYGETLVVDWGLAKSVGRPDPAAGSATLDQRTLVPNAGSDLRRTNPGSVLGTPAYMSPEQAAGQVDRLGPASDVYSLGATLYYLLTGRAPFNDKGLTELLPKVQRGEFPPPRQVQGWVDPALESICLKAMKLRPEDRYATPRDLADDVEHWLADEPVGAYREPNGVKLKRWMRKHPSRVSGIAAAGLVTILALAIGGLMLDQSRRAVEKSNSLLAEKTEEAERNADVARRNAEEAQEMFKQARGAVDRYFTQVAGDAVLDRDGMRPLRRRLLSYAREYYEDFIQKHPEDPSLGLELAEAYTRSAHLAEDREKNRKLFEVGFRRFEGLLEAAPNDREVRKGMANSIVIRYINVAGTNSAEDYFNLMTYAIGLLEGLWVEQRENDACFLLGEAYSNRALHKAYRGRYQEAWSDTRRGTEILHQGLEEWPGDPNLLISLCRVYRRGNRLDFQLRGVEAGRRQLELQSPTLPIARDEFVKALGNAVFNFLERHGRPSGAEPYLREALDVNHKNMREFAEGSGLEFDLSGWLGESSFLQGRTRAAATILAEVAAGKGVYSPSFPLAMTFHYRDNHARFLSILGMVEGERGDLPAAIEHGRSALAEHGSLLEEDAGNRAISSDSLWNTEALARFRFLAGEIDRDGWIAARREVLEGRKRNAAIEPRELPV
ncbi:MAG: serine/threonine-protein kinase [Isosphaeraceae bacterium]